MKFIILIPVLLLLVFLYVSFKEKKQPLPIISAIKKHDPNKLKDIINNDPNIVNKDLDGRAFLYIAAKEDFFDGVNILLENGANANGNGVGASPLHMACLNGNLEMVKILLKYGADINYIRPINEAMADHRFKETPLDFAYASGNKDLIRYLIEKGAVTWIDTLPKIKN